MSGCRGTGVGGDWFRATRAKTNNTAEILCLMNDKNKSYLRTNMDAW